MKHPTLFLLLAAVSFCRGATFVVMNADSAGPGSLSDAISQAKALPAGTASTVEFDPAYFSIPRIIKPGPEGLLGYINRPVEINGPPLINGQPALLLSGDVNNDGHAGPGDGSLGTMELYPTPGFFALRRVAVAHCYSKDYFPGLYFGGRPPDRMETAPATKSFSMPESRGALPAWLWSRCRN